jgi:hypothetical protein
MSATVVPTAEQEQRAKWDLLLLDIEHRSEQLRQLKVFEPRRMIIQGVTATAVLVGAGAALGGVLVKLLIG